MNLTKDITISIFLHLIMFTTALLLSVSLSGGSSKISDYRVISVNIISEKFSVESSGSKDRNEVDFSKGKIKEGQYKKVEFPKASIKIHDVKKKQIEATKLIDSKNEKSIERVVEVKSGSSIEDVVDIDTERMGEDYVYNNSDVTNGVTQKASDGTGTFSSSEDSNSVSAGIELTRSSGNEERQFNLIKDIIRRYIESAKAYPTLARRRGIEGVVYVKFRVNPDGQPVDIQIIKRSGSSILDKGALKIIKKAAPFPYVEGAIEVPISFRLSRERG